MVRPRPSAFVLTLSVLSVLPLVAACSSSPEQQLLQKYFQASRMRDNTTLANIATVSYSPTEQGTVQSFDVVSAATEERRPLKLRDLATAEEEARKADEDLKKRQRDYQDKNLTAIERVLKAENTKGVVRGPDAEVQKMWAQLRDDTQQQAKRVADARQALSAERSLAEASVYDARNPVDTTQYDGELITKDLTIKAQVRAPDGTVQEKNLTVSLSRTELTNGPEGKKVSGRWIVTNITDAGAGAAPS